MKTWLIIIAIIFILVGMKLAKFAGVAFLVALLIIFILKNINKDIC